MLTNLKRLEAVFAPGLAAVLLCACAAYPDDTRRRSPFPEIAPDTMTAAADPTGGHHG